MSKTIPVQLQTHLDGETTTLATLWRITRTDSTILRFTDHDKPIVVSGDTYNAVSGYDVTSIQSQEDLSVDNLDIQGILSSADISEADIVAGLYLNALVEVMIVNHQSPSDGTVTLRKGWIGQITLKRDVFVAELRGLATKLSQQIVQVSTPTCRADLGNNAECKLNLTTFTFTGTVQTVTDNSTFTLDDTGLGDGYFSHGVLTWTSGNNNGLQMEVAGYTSTTGEVTLFEPMPYAVQIGDSYSVHAGCDKFLDTCINKFNNLVNFHGEPYLPGPDAANRYIIRA